jgi:hypothetical protein
MWLWPIFQTLHYFGLCLLLGTVGLVRSAPARDWQGRAASDAA